MRIPLFLSPWISYFATMNFRKVSIRSVAMLLGIAAITLFNACKKEKGSTTEPVEKVIEIRTADGVMYMWLYDSTPLHKKNFLKLADSGFFDSTTFHRIVRDFVIQGGDPLSKDSIKTNDGSGGPGYTIPAEFSDSLKHIYGAVGAARDNNPLKASNGSQFYIVTDINGEPTLNKNYTVFGYIFSGMDVALAISQKQKDIRDRPLKDIKMDVNVIEMSTKELNEVHHIKRR